MCSKNKRFVAVGSFILIFGVLLTLASLFDLQISQILAEPNLSAGRYFSTSFMCNLVEVMAMAPIWGFATFAACILTVYFHGKKGLPDTCRSFSLVCQYLRELPSYGI